MGDNALMRNAIQRWRNAIVTVVVASASLCAIASAHAQAQAQADTDFVAAKAAFERGDWRQLDALAPALSGHVLARYVEYWQLKSRLDAAAPEAVQSFVARYPDGPLSDRLRVDWLKVLGKRGDWNRFALDYPLATSEDTELACYGAQYRYRRGRDRGGKTALVHGVVHARRMRTGVRGAHRARRPVGCRPPRAFPARRSRRQCASRAGDRRRPSGRRQDRRARPAGRGSRSVAKPSEGPVRLEDRGGPRARAVCARARGTQGCGRGARRVAEVARAFHRGGSQLRQPAPCVSRGAAVESAGEPVVSRTAARRADAGRAGVAHTR